MIINKSYLVIVAGLEAGTSSLVIVVVSVDAGTSSLWGIPQSRFYHITG